MKFLTFLIALVSTANAFQAPAVTSTTGRATTTVLSMAKYNNMNEILAKFPEDKPILINIYDANTESAIKEDILRAKSLLADSLTMVSMKRQDYPEIAKLWDADKKSPAMILFKDGQPVARLYEETHYLEIAAKMRKFCE
jgi:thioredoxin-like negative regulator of GroEL